MNNNFWGDKGAAQWSGILFKKFEKARKVLKDKMDTSTDAQERDELEQELERLKKDHLEKERQIDNSLF